MPRWKLHPSEDAVVWDLRPDEVHTDDYEMAGYRCAFVVRYGQDENGFVLAHHPIFPTLRLRPNNTHATYQLDIQPDRWPMPAADGKPVRERLIQAKLNGTLELKTVSADGTLPLGAVSSGIRAGLYHECRGEAGLCRPDRRGLRDRPGAGPDGDQHLRAARTAGERDGHAGTGGETHLGDRRHGPRRRRSRAAGGRGGGVPPQAGDDRAAHRADEAGHGEPRTGSDVPLFQTAGGRVRL